MTINSGACSNEHHSFIDPRTAVPCRTTTFSEDGQYLVEANYLGFITVKHSSTGEIVNRFMAQTALVECIKFQPGTKNLFVAGAGYEGGRDFGRVKIISIPDGRRIGALGGHSDDITDIGFLNCNRPMAVTVALDRHVLVHDLESHELIWSWEYEDYLNAIANRPGTQEQFAIIGDSPYSYVLDASTQSVVAKLETPGDTNGLIWSDDGRYLVIGSDDGSLKYFDSAVNWKLIYTEKLPGAIKKTVADPLLENKGICSCYDGQIWAFDLVPAVHSNPSVICGRKKGLWGINVAVTCDRIATPSFNDQAFLFSRTSIGTVKELVGEEPQPTFGCNWIDINGNMIAVSHDDGRIRLREKHDGSLISIIGGDSSSLFMGLAFHPFLPLIATVDFNGEIFVYDLDTGSLLERQVMNYGPGISLAYSGDGRYLVSGGYGPEAWIHEVSDEGRLSRPKALKSSNKSVVKSVVFSDKNDIIVGAADGSVFYYEFDSGLWKTPKTLATNPSMELCNGVVFCNQRKIIYAVSRDQSLRALDPCSENEIASSFVHNRSVKTVDVSKDGNLVVTGGYDRMIIIWSTKNGLNPILPPLRGSNSGISCVRIDDDRLYTCSFDGYVTCWHLSSGIQQWCKTSLDCYNKL